MSGKPFRRIRGSIQETEQAARYMRKTPTAAEAHLWRALRGRQCNGLKFRRQHPIGQFIVDFYCAAHKLVIEVDGEVHTNQTDYDQARTERLESFGCQVLRVSNAQVLNDLQDVLKKIEHTTKTK